MPDYPDPPDLLTGGLSEEALAPLNRLAILGRNLAGVLHQVNNHLQVISGAVEMLQDAALSPDVAKRVARIHDHSSRAAGVVGELLRFARATSTDLAPIPVRPLVEQAVALLQYPLTKAGVSVIVEGLADVPAILGSSADIQQAVLNLLINAQFALANRPSSQIRIVAAVVGDRIELAVSDNGPGVPADLRERIFEPFFTTHPADGAAGLGLPVARAIAARHGGRVTLRDAAGGGAVFVISLPMLRAVPGR